MITTTDELLASIKDLKKLMWGVRNTQLKSIPKEQLDAEKEYLKDIRADIAEEISTVTEVVNNKPKAKYSNDTLRANELRKRLKIDMHHQEQKVKVIDLEVRDRENKQLLTNLDNERKALCVIIPALGILIERETLYERIETLIKKVGSNE